ncbi:unnamed protein product [Dibothriocephalus latus]|uniref:Glycerol-3-phosphate dehydrogenase [NAD(+)] n=1 Tax=Dibothriocephalus latus TaxID=60516 RepID=A0A3P7LCL7_DIBLA|nr:unnamed protein product [Dibothriocephalus latus]
MLVKRARVPFTSTLFLLLRGVSIMTIKRRVAIIGSGNWGSTIGKIVGYNVLNLEAFDDEVKMWVFEEIVNGKRLTEIINTSHENIKYLPGIKLPPNLIADPDLANCTKDADVLMFVVPHQFLSRACDTIEPGLDEKAGVGVRLLTDLIRERLKIPCAVLMGANLAGEVAKEMFCEATVASLDLVRGRELKALFETPYFRVSVIKDEVGAELCGALKNIVAVGAGLAQGLGYGDNTKAAIIRLGFMEMKKFIFEFFGDRCEFYFLWLTLVC